MNDLKNTETYLIIANQNVWIFKTTIDFKCLHISIEELNSVPGVEDLCPIDHVTKHPATENIFFLETSGELCLTPRKFLLQLPSERTIFILISSFLKKVKLVAWNPPRGPIHIQMSLFIWNQAIGHPLARVCK